MAGVEANIFGKNQCHNCGDRKVGCHGECPKYAEFRKTVEEIRKAERDAKTLEGYAQKLGKRRPRK